MIEIIPSINALTWDEAQLKLKAILGATEWVEIDVGDGVFTPSATWNTTMDLKTMELGQMKIAAHLMVRHPEAIIGEWIQAGVRRIIIQWDALAPRGLAWYFQGWRARRRIRKIADQCRKNWVEFGLSLGQQSRLRQVGKLLELCSVVQVLAGRPGPARQAFDQTSLERLRELVFLRQAKQLGFKTELDIGVNPDTIEAIKQSGADIAASTSFVFNSANPVFALEYLKKKAIGLV